MVCSYQVNLRKGGAAGKTVAVVLFIWDSIPVRDGPSVMGSVVSTGPRTAVLRHEIGADDQEPLSRLAVTFRSMSSNSALATAKRFYVRRRGRQATDGPCVVRMLCIVL